MSKSAFSDAHQMLVEAIVAARREAGLTQAEVAYALRKNQSYVSNIERGQRRIDVLEFYMLARCIGVEPEQLFQRATRGFPSSFDI